MLMLALAAALAAPQLFQGTMRIAETPDEACRLLLVPGDRGAVRALFWRANGAPLALAGTGKDDVYDLRSEGGDKFAGRVDEGGFRGSYTSEPDRWTLELPAAKGAAPVPETGSWVGTIGDEPVRVELPWKPALEGTLRNTRSDDAHELRGAATPAGVFVLTERLGNATFQLAGLVLADPEKLVAIRFKRRGAAQILQLIPVRSLPLEVKLRSEARLVPRFSWVQFGNCSRDRVWPGVVALKPEPVRARLDAALRDADPVQKPCKDPDDPPESTTYAVTQASPRALALELRHTSGLAQKSESRCALADLVTGEVRDVKTLVLDAAAVDAAALGKLPPEAKARLDEVFGGRDQKATFDSLCVKDGQLIVRYVEADPPIYVEHDVTLPAAAAAPLFKRNAALDSLLR